MKRGILVVLLTVFLAGCFSPNIKIGGDKPLVDIKYGGKDKKDKNDD
ncbi:MAG: hypothetical protein GXP25_06100 [Planctomycetes bacterium]|nr:hypothetical protein [Planctomycetota bacterium]